MIGAEPHRTKALLVSPPRAAAGVGDMVCCKYRICCCCCCCCCCCLCCTCCCKCSCCCRSCCSHCSLLFGDGAGWGYCTLPLFLSCEGCRKTGPRALPKCDADDPACGS